MLQRSELLGRTGGNPMKSQQQTEYYKRAAEARRLATEAIDPAEKVDLQGGAGLVVPRPRCPG